MSDLVERARTAAGHVSLPLDERRVDGIIARAQARGRRRFRLRVAALVGTAAIVLVASWTHLLSPTELTFADGSTVLPLSRRSEIRTSLVAPERTMVEVVRGGARFRVTRNPQRVFTVRARGVTVEVIGTEFKVELSGDEVAVQVERGRVRVLANGERALLAAGESVRVRADGSAELTAAERGPSPGPDRAPASPSAAPAAPSAVGPALSVPLAASPSAAPAIATPGPAVRTVVPGTRDGRHAWRRSAEAGNFERAYAELARDGSQAVRDLPDELLLAADVARLSNHPAEAVPRLDRIVREFSRDPRAQLAAFTLGRVLLDELGRPGEAAAAFARSRALSRSGPLASDALAREVESWSRAGEHAKASERARQYVREFPDGAQIAKVRRFGGLE